MFGKKILVSIVALTAACCGAFGAVNRGGTLRVQPGASGVKVAAQSNTTASVAATGGSRMMTMPGMNSVVGKPKMPNLPSCSRYCRSRIGCPKLCNPSRIGCGR